jgi:hypothetical protein
MCDRSAIHLQKIFFLRSISRFAQIESGFEDCGKLSG